MLGHLLINEIARTGPSALWSGPLWSGPSTQQPVWDEDDMVRSFGGRWDGRPETEPPEHMKVFYNAVDTVLGVRPPKRTSLVLPGDEQMPTVWDWVTAGFSWLREPASGGSSTSDALTTRTSADLEALILAGFHHEPDDAYFGESAQRTALNAHISERVQTLRDDNARTLLLRALHSVATERDLGNITEVAKEALAVTLATSAAGAWAYGCVVNGALLLTAPAGAALATVGGILCLMPVVPIYVSTHARVEDLLGAEKVRRYELQLMHDYDVAQERKRLGLRAMNVTEAWLRRDFVHENARQAMHEVCQHLVALRPGDAEVKLTLHPIMAANSKLRELCQDLIDGASVAAIASTSWSDTLLPTSLSKVLLGARIESSPTAVDKFPSLFARAAAFFTDTDAWVTKDAVDREMFAAQYRSVWGRVVNASRGLHNTSIINKSMDLMHKLLMLIPRLFMNIIELFTGKGDLVTRITIFCSKLSEQLMEFVSAPFLYISAITVLSPMLVLALLKQLPAAAQTQIRHHREGPNKEEQEAQARRREKLKQNTYPAAWKEHTERRAAAHDTCAAEKAQLSLLSLDRTEYISRIQEAEKTRDEALKIADSVWEAVEAIKLVHDGASQRVGDLLDAWHGQMELDLAWTDLAAEASRGALDAEKKARFDKLSALLGRPNSATQVPEIKRIMETEEAKQFMTDFMTVALNSVVQRTKYTINHATKKLSARLADEAAMEGRATQSVRIWEEHGELEAQTDEDEESSASDVMQLAMAKLLEPMITAKLQRMSWPVALTMKQIEEIARADAARRASVMRSDPSLGEPSGWLTEVPPSELTDHAMRTLAGERTNWYFDHVAETPIAKAWDVFGFLGRSRSAPPATSVHAAVEEEEEETDSDKEAGATAVLLVALVSFCAA